MRKTLFLFYLFITQVMLSKTAEEHYKEAEAYSQKSKQGYMIAAAVLVFIVAIKFINKDKKE
jgi:hypothetical protein